MLISYLIPRPHIPLKKERESSESPQPLLCLHLNKTCMWKQSHVRIIALILMISMRKNGGYMQNCFPCLGVPDRSRLCGCLYMYSIDSCKGISSLNKLNYSSIVVWAALTHSSHVLSRKHELIKIRG